MDAERFDIPQYLSVLPLFSALSPAQRQCLALGCVMQALPRGERVFSAGDACEAFMFLGMTCMVNAEALSDVMLLQVRKEVVLGEIARDGQLALNMLAGISRRLHGLIRDVEGYTLHSGMQRLIGYLLREAETAASGEAGEPMVVELGASKATIASRLSLTPEYFSRVLHELDAAGLIEIDKREIRIPDVQRLAGYGSH
jgi:CRP-like cAMP-binding protein